MKVNRYSKSNKTDITPSDTIKDNLIISRSINHQVINAFNMLRTKTLSKCHDNSWNVLAITSPKPHSGKTFVAINLAISIAMEKNHSVLLVDFNFNNQKILHYFGLTSKKGLLDYFYNETPFSDILIHTDIERLVLLSSGSHVSGSSELLSSSKMLSLISEIKTRYSDRIIIIDLPPLLSTADAMTFLPNVDACLLVVAEGESTFDDIKQSMQLINENKLLGTVFNKSNDPMILY